MILLIFLLLTCPALADDKYEIIAAKLCIGYPYKEGDVIPVKLEELEYLHIYQDNEPVSAWKVNLFCKERAKFIFNKAHRFSE